MTIRRRIGRLFQFLFVEPVNSMKQLFKINEGNRVSKRSTTRRTCSGSCASGLNAAHETFDRKGVREPSEHSAGESPRMPRDKPKAEAEASVAPRLTSGIQARVRGCDTR